MDILSFQLNPLKKHILFFAGVLIFCGIYYPGLMNPDAESIYTCAKNHQYIDHHPPLLAYFWHYCLYIIDGPHLVFALLMSFLWGAVYILSFKIFREGWPSFLSMFLPFIPHIAVYGGFIFKDNVFTFGYLFLSMILAYKTLHKKKFTVLGSILFFATAFFCTSVKYQAKFIFPILAFWYLFVQFKSFSWKTILAALLLGLGMNYAILSVNHHLVTEHGSGSHHSWQYKKIYDLAGISLNSGKIVLPEFLVREGKTLDDIRSHYEGELAWEPLVVYDHSPLVATKTDEERAILHETWLKNIFEHPSAYFKHRMRLWSRGLLLAAPGKGWLESKMGQDWQHERLGPFASLPLFIHHFATITAFIFLVPFLIYFYFLGFRGLKVAEIRPYAQSLLFLIGQGTFLLLLLFFFSLAATPRYIYFSACTFMFSVPFAWTCWQHFRRS